MTKYKLALHDFQPPFHPSQIKTLAASKPMGYPGCIDANNSFKYLTAELILIASYESLYALLFQGFKSIYPSLSIKTKNSSFIQ